MNSFNLRTELGLRNAIIFNLAFDSGISTIKLSNSELTGIIIMKEATYRPKRAAFIIYRQKKKDLK